MCMKKGTSVLSHPKWMPYHMNINHVLIVWGLINHRILWVRKICHAWTLALSVKMRKIRFGDRKVRGQDILIIINLMWELVFLSLSVSIHLRCWPRLHTSEVFRGTRSPHTLDADFQSLPEPKSVCSMSRPHANLSERNESTSSWNSSPFRFTAILKHHIAQQPRYIE